MLAAAILVSAAMLGVDIRNSTGKAPYTESRFGYIAGGVVAFVGLVLMLVGLRPEQPTHG